MPRFGDCGYCEKFIGNNARKVIQCNENSFGIWWHEGCVKKREAHPQKETWRCPDCVQAEHLRNMEALPNVVVEEDAGTRMEDAAGGN